MQALFSQSLANKCLEEGKAQMLFVSKLGLAYADKKQEDCHMEGL